MTTAGRSRKLLGWARDLALFLVALYGVIWWQTRDMLPADGSLVIPAQTLVSLAGEVVNIGPDPARETLVYFFAPWCGVCRNSIGHLAAVDPATTRVVVIALDYASREAVEAFVAETGVTDAVFLGTDATKAAFQVQGYPTYYVLDRDFRVTGKSMGYATVATLRLGI